MPLQCRQQGELVPSPIEMEAKLKSAGYSKIRPLIPTRRILRLVDDNDHSDSNRYRYNRLSPDVENIGAIFILKRLVK